MLEGSCRLMAGLLYGSGMRLLECLRLRIKNVDVVRGEIVVRDGKRAKDRRVPLPGSLRGELMRQRERALLLHAADLAEGAGRVFLPHALARKYPNADVEPCWQYLFSAARRSVDPRSGHVGRHHVSEEVLQRAVQAARRQERRYSSWCEIIWCYGAGRPSRLLPSSRICIRMILPSASATKPFTPASTRIRVGA